MNTTFERSVGVIAGLSAGLFVLYYMYGPRIQQKIAEETEPPVVTAPDPADLPAAAESGPRYPVPDVADAAPAPAPAAPRAERAPAAAEPRDLAASDGAVRSELAAVFGAEPIEAFLIDERVIQNIVATVDSLDREPVPLKYRAIGPVSELPVVDHGGDTMVLSDENGARYAYLVGALERADSHALAKLYFRYYPLFARAYRELGYPQGHFNDRVVAVIDHLLATPELRGPVELIRPKVLYQFADPALEDLSSGQKTLLRMGPENAAIVKAKLRELRAILAARGRSEAPPAG